MGEIIHVSWFFHYKPSILGYPKFQEIPIRQYVSQSWLPRSKKAARPVPKLWFTQV
jgi:hypothetical protein